MAGINMARGNQAFFMKHGKVGEVLVEVTSWEDRGEFWYVSWRPVLWLDGKRVPGGHLLGQFGSKRYYKDRRHGETFRRAPVRVYDAPNLGWGSRMGRTVAQAEAA